MKDNQEGLLECVHLRIVQLCLTSSWVLPPILPINYVISCELAPQAWPWLYGKSVRLAALPLCAFLQRPGGIQRFEGRSLEQSLQSGPSRLSEPPSPSPDITSHYKCRKHHFNTVPTPNSIIVA